MSDWLNQVHQAFYARDYDRAREILESWVEAEPQSPHSRYHLANLHRYLKHVHDAVEVMLPLEHDPAMPAEYVWRLFELRMEAGRLEQAAGMLDRLDPDNDASAQRLELALACARQAGRHRQGARFAERLPDSEGRAEMRAVLRLIALLRWLPGALRRPMLREASGRLLRAGRWRRCRVTLEAARALEPDNVDWPDRLAFLSRASRDPFDPRFHDEHNWLAVACRLEPDSLDLQRRMLEVLHDLDPREPPLNWIETHPQLKDETGALWIRAASLANLERYDEAARLYQQLDSTDSWRANFCSGMIALQGEDFNSAINAFQAADSRAGDDRRCFAARFFENASVRLADDCSFQNGQEILDQLDREFDEEGVSDKKPCRSRCPQCGHEDEFSPLWIDTTTHWPRARCPQCGLIAVHPMPSESEIAAIYTDAGRGGQSVNRGYRRLLLEAMQAPEDQLRHVSSYREATEWGELFDWESFESSLPETKRCLDVGCASGRTVAAFHRLGWDASGVDPDPQAIACAREHRLNVMVGSIESVDSGGFDLITLADVIEHVSDPLAMMGTVYEKLAPGGLAYVKTPCADSLPHRLVGQRWLESSEHLLFFSERTLADLARRCGFEIAAVDRALDPSTPLLHYALWQAMRFPLALHGWIDRLQCGDAVRMLLRKP